MTSSFKNRAPFSIPQVAGQSRRKQAQRKQKNRQQMSIQPKQPQTQTLTENKSYRNISMVSTLPVLKAQITSVDQKFHFLLSQPHPDDATLYWYYQLSNQVTNEVSRTLIFRQQQYCLRNLEEQYIFDYLAITMDNLNGYKDHNGVFTNRVCVLQLASITAIIDDAKRKTYDVVYKQTQDVSWTIPLDLAEIRFRIVASLDSDPLNNNGSSIVPLTGTLTTPMNCQFDIRHSGR